mmetsp:Transcript_64258/g.155353  ORF Transcript_64258/g.155353 Transcript_64258/m.155353 type:complete len:94 (-) Transcript_64258:1734-2015(-)
MLTGGAGVGGLGVELSRLVGDMMTKRDKVLDARGGNKPTTPEASASFERATAEGSVLGGVSEARESQRPPISLSCSETVLQFQPSGAAASFVP